jgi:protein-S-isoprenylcysteine O-methyltransferase Ste14
MASLLSRQMKPAFLNFAKASVWLAANLAPLYLIWLLWPRQGPVRPMPAGAGIWDDPLWRDALLALLFPLQHSVWTQPPIKQKMLNWAGANYERPLYALASGAVLVVMCFFWRGSERLIWAAPGWWIWTGRAGIVATLGVQLYCTRIVGMKYLSGLEHLSAAQENRPIREPRFKEAGPYRRIRHPIAASQIVMLWMAGSLYADRLLLSGLWTLWIIGATMLEDRRLAAEFGEVYSDYRRRAGFLWPRLRPLD